MAGISATVEEVSVWVQNEGKTRHYLDHPLRERY